MIDSIRGVLSRNRWWGKFLGAGLGFVIRGPLGALIGALIGHQFDRGLLAGMRGIATDDDAVRELFFEATFAVMGHVAKADGRVSEREIHIARVNMQRFDLSEAQKLDAMRFFTDGKRSDFPLDDTLARLRRTCAGRKRILHQFVELQVEAMLADKKPHPNTRKILWRICQQLKISRVELAQMEAAARVRMGGPSGPADLSAAYRVLGVEANADDKTVKNAYRRLMNLHHPDKLAARGLPKEMLNQAREQTQAIQAAYETVKARRGSN